MTELCFTDKNSLESKLKKAISGHICGSFDILKTPNGKPYIEGNPLCFSLSHSKDSAVYVLSDKPVGVDLELFQDRKYTSVLSRFTDRERAEIGYSRDKFLINWTAKEAFIKMRGLTLAKDLKNLEYAGGKLFFRGEQQPCEITVKIIENFGICTICEGELQ